MPKEIIDNRWANTYHRTHANCPGETCLLDCAGIEVPASESYLEVGWTKLPGTASDAMQIGIVNPTVLAEDGSPQQIWMDLDRVGCNRLITAIRKARAGAFGKDE